MNSKIATKSYHSKIVLAYLKNAELFWVISFSLLTAVAAQISVPVLPVPFTLQTLAVLMAGALLGPVNGALSMTIYLLAGIFGLPVFANFAGGMPHVFGPTGGYLLAFPLAAYIVGSFIRIKNNSVFIFTGMLLGTAVILLFGAFYLSLFINGDLNAAFYSGVLTFSWWELLKTAAAASIYASLKKRYPTLPNRIA